MTLSAIVISSLIGGTTVKADAISDLKDEQNKLHQESSVLEEELKNKENQLSELQLKKGDLQKQISDISADIDALTAEIDKLAQKIEQKNRDIVVLTEEITELKDLIKRREEKLADQARAVQKSDHSFKYIEYVLEAETFSDFISRSAAVGTIIDTNNDVMTQQMNDRQELEEKQLALTKEKEQLDELKQQNIVNQNNLIARQDEMNDQVSKLLAQEELTKSEKDKIAVTQQSIADKVSKLDKDILAEQERQEAIRIEEERKAAELAKAEQKATESKLVGTSSTNSENNAANSVSNNESNANQSAPSSSGFIQPANGTITAGFGNRSNPFGGGASENHLGLDIAGGGQIKAATSGKVEYAGYMGSYGYMVLIDHGTVNGQSLKTAYAHMQPSLAVAPGQSVSQGQTLGIMGTTGRSTGVHLHFEVRVNSVHVDPRGYL